MFKLRNKLILDGQRTRELYANLNVILRTIL